MSGVETFDFWFTAPQPKTGAQPAASTLNRGNPGMLSARHIAGFLAACSEQHIFSYCFLIYLFFDRSSPLSCLPASFPCCLSAFQDGVRILAQWRGSMAPRVACCAWTQGHYLPFPDLLLRCWPAWMNRCFAPCFPFC